MELSRVANERKLYLCKWYFRVGLCFLPAIWAINFYWFFAEAFRKPEYTEQKLIRRYVVLSGIGALIWIIGIGIWVVVFQAHREIWGKWADDLSFIIPMGIA